MNDDDNGTIIGRGDADDQAHELRADMADDPRDAEIERLRAELAHDPRDAEIERLRAELSLSRAAKAKAKADEADDVERIPYLVTLACGDNDVVDNAAGATEHHCTECDTLRKVTGVTLA